MILSNSGSLVSGTYQLCYRLIRQKEYSVGSDYIYDYKESKFSLPTAPIFISDKIDNLSAGDGQIGRSSDNRIRMSITVSDEEIYYYTHYQVAVLRRLDGQYLPPTEAYLFEPIPLEGLTFPTTFEVSSNYEYNEIAVSKIIIDNAPIESFKTIEQKNNIAFIGAIKYYNRDVSTTTSFNKSLTTSFVKNVGRSYDPTQPSGKQGYSDAIVNHKNIGHFRDEVYRYAIGYIDEFGNASPPKIINFSGCFNNKIQDTASLDWRFPRRDEDGFTLFDSSGNIQALGLRISEIDNHPTWARGMYILRAKRREDIKFQTPIIPLSLVQPAIANTETSTEKKFPVADGSALADVNGTLIPKDFRRYNLTQSSRRAADGSSGNWTSIQKGDPETFVHMVFPSQYMYQNGADILENITENSVKSLKIVDAVGLKFSTSSFTQQPSGLSAPGKYRNETHTLYATTSDQYYYEDGQASKDKITEIDGFNYADIRILEYGTVENFGSKYVIRSSVEDLSAPNVFGYDNIDLSPTTASKADVLRAGVIVTNKSLRDPSYETLVSNGAIQYDLNGTATGIINSSGGTEDVHIVSSVLVANAVTGLSETRYGGETDYNEFIPVQFEVYGTGIYSTRYMFNPTEIARIQAGQSNPITVDIWGGDCFISRHNFKISNGTVRLTGNDGITYNTSSAATIVADISDYWGAEHAVSNSGATGAYSMPVGVEGYSQIIELYLESNINADLIQRDTCQTAGENYSLIESSAFEVRTPFDYNYMLSYSLENALKLFVPDNTLDRDSNNYNSRMGYSNTRILDTNIEGFDEFPVSNIYDLEGKYGGITKLVNFTNKLFAIQEKSFSYIPVQANIIETAVDSNQLAIRSAEVIGLPSNITVDLGSQHIKSVVVSDGSLYFVDVKNKKIAKMSDKMSVISEQNLGSEFDIKFSENISEKDLISYYDSVRYKYVIIKRYNGSGWAYMWNDKFGVWETELYEQENVNMNRMFYISPTTYVIGINASGNLAIESMFTNNDSVWLGTYVVPNIKFTAIPNGAPAVFDNIYVDSDSKVDSIQMTVARDPDLGNYYTEYMELEKDPKEGLYKIKVLRNINASAVDYTSLSTDASTNDKAQRTGQRMRGLYAENEIRWKTSGVTSVSSVFSKFRNGKRAI